MDIRINPHFQDLTLLWIQNIEYALVSIILFYSYVKNKNKVALLLSMGAFTGTIGYVIVGYVYQTYPADLGLQALASNILAQVWFYASFTFIILGVISVKFPNISLYIGIPIFIYGLLAIAPYVVNFSPFEILQDGSIDFHRTFIDDFSQFMFGIVGAYGFSSIFFNTYKKLTDKIPAIFFGLGFFGIMCLPAISASTSGTIAYYLQYGVIAGGLFHLIGIFLSAIRKPLLKEI
ncbi:hypothetical protein GW793_01020 [bacterium]|uniref:Uncharacterized protein n=2 Tax=Katanobacteria TaxID=422282 RepID=A0A2M7X0Y7_UNCKA|nr:hypothetical protein [bacterium]PIP56068.1 MAG: hypothetical protein COX05_05070 [candidate division WWE3 bacterium CG22_combo_CG10-13_8_21_14_all_39_12]PJA39845.1 MAG: hypothetical protein CO179_04240 [candidate division WWE3 bacterium CG_4_9_14_3_um_filter_39_7]